MGSTIVYVLCALWERYNERRMKRIVDKYLPVIAETGNRAIQAARDGNTELYNHWSAIHRDLIFKHLLK